MSNTKDRCPAEADFSLLATLVSLVLVLSCASPAFAQRSLVTNAGQSLIDRETSFLSGWAWQSVEQAPNYQGDSDVGTSSVGMAFLEMHNATADTAYLKAAEEAGRWLVSAQTSAGWWPDYDNADSISPSGQASYGFSSLDDGAVGQAVFLWKLYQKTGNLEYETAALKGADWLVTYARAPAGKSCPSQQCYWYWWVPPSNGKTIYLGLGSGIAGIFCGLERLAQLTVSGPTARLAV